MIDEGKRVDRPCRKCGARSVVVYTHTSSCGGYVDDQYKCEACSYTWWIDGVDS